MQNHRITAWCIKHSTRYSSKIKLKHKMKKQLPGCIETQHVIQVRLKQNIRSKNNCLVVANTQHVMRNKIEIKYKIKRTTAWWY